MELTGFFKYKFNDQELIKYSIINGHSREGGLVTLLNNYEIIKKIPWSTDTAFQFFDSDTVIWGESFEDYKSIKFQKFSIEFPFFNNIFRDFLIKTNFNENKINYEDKLDYSINIHDDVIKISLYTLIKEGIFKYELEQKGGVVISTDSLIEYEIFKSKFLYPIQNFFGFITDSYNHVIESNAELNIDGKEYPKIISFYDTFQHKRNRTTKIDPLFHIDKTNSEIFSSLLVNWMKNYNRLETVIDLYTDVIYREGNSPKVQFLTLVQSAEYYHSMKFLYKAKSLKERLYELFEMGNFVFEEIFLDIDFITIKIKNTRNYYTHYNPKIEKEIAKGEELSLLLLILLMLNKIFILQEIGMPEKEIKNSILSQGYYRNTKELIKKFNYK